MVIAKKFIYVTPFDTVPKEENVKIVEEKLPPLKDGEFLVEAVFLSVDPYMRLRTAPLGSTMIGEQVGKIIETKNKNYPVGKHVVSQFGWRTHSISDGTERGLFPMSLYTIAEVEGIPLSLHLGILGMPGATAYFGFLEVLKPKAGETVVITSAAGAVGSHVGQIAKIKGLTVIGIAGSDEKLNWLKSLGFDYVINYKTEDVRAALAKSAPKGVDVYFDNVGGELSGIVLQQMNFYGRTAVCGSISSYNAKEEPKVTIVQPTVLMKALTMQGFIVTKWIDRFDEAVEQNTKWIQEGKLKYKETTIEGFENTLKALIGILKGDSIGKVIVKV